MLRKEKICGRSRVRLSTCSVRDIQVQKSNTVVTQKRDQTRGVKEEDAGEIYSTEGEDHLAGRVKGRGPGTEL